MADPSTDDLYRILGVPRTATKEQIQAAYKKKARALHPDVNKSPDAEDRFKEVAAAYAILKDDDQRRRYDHHGFRKKPSPNAARPPPRPPPGFTPKDFGFGDVRFEDIRVDTDDLRNPFDYFMRRERQRKRKKRKREVQLKISLEHAYQGATLNMVLDLPTDLGTTETHRIRLKIPVGAKAGDRMKLKNPECIVILAFDDDDRYAIDGRDVTTHLKISPWEAALGSKVACTTPAGPVHLKIPEGASSGQKLRLRGKGIPMKVGRPGEPGDLYVILEMVGPKRLTEEERKLFERLSEVSRFNPRE